MAADSRLILTCGLPGAGKTTLAKDLAASRPAVRFTKDEWLWALGTTPWDRPMNVKLEAHLWRLAQETLPTGVSVVIDFGLWKRYERDEMRSIARDLGVGVELHFLDAPMDELWARVSERNSRPPWESAPITREHMAEFDAFFEPPDAVELALFDGPPPREDPSGTRP
jgi:predicted kinase